MWDIFSSFLCFCSSHSFSQSFLITSESLFLFSLRPSTLSTPYKLYVLNSNSNPLKMQILPFFAVGSLVTLANALSAHYGNAKFHPKAAEAKRSIIPAGGWSLSMAYAACPVGTFSCFTDQTGNVITQNREQNCCPEGTTPELFCGTYVNTGQPYACCPIGRDSFPLGLC